MIRRDTSRWLLTPDRRGYVLGVVFSIALDGRRASIRDRRGLVYTIDDRSQGIDFAAIREGDVVSCTLSPDSIAVPARGQTPERVAAPRVLRADTVDVASRQVDAVVCAGRPEFGRVDARDPEGQIYVLTPNIAGLLFEDLRVGDTLRCTVTLFNMLVLRVQHISKF